MVRYSLKSDGRYLAALLLLTGLIFGFGLGSFGLVDPDEPFYSLSAKEMLANHDLSTPSLFGQPQFEKPILFYWVLCLCFKIFGVSEFASRLGPLVAGIATVVITYLWGVVLFRSRQIAFVSAVVLATATEFVVVSRIVLTDVYLCLFVTAALFCFSLGHENQKIRKTTWFFIFVACALGFLTKGPIGVIFPGMGILAYLLFSRETVLIKQFPWFLGLIAFAVIGLSWYVLMTARYGIGFLEHFFIHENVRRFFFAEHKSHDKIFLYPGALLIGFFPWGAFLIVSMFYGFRRAFGQRPGIFRKPLLFLSLFFIPTFFFLTFAKSKLLSYILPVFPTVALFMGVWMSLAYRSVRQGAVLKSMVRMLTFLFWGILPLGLVVGAGIYSVSNKMGLFWPVLFMGIVLIPLSWGALWSFYARKCLQAFYLMLAAVSFSYMIAFGWLIEAADKTFSSKKDAALYETLTSRDSHVLILASKLFVRGACYYTGNRQVAVLTGDPKGAFYTKHPIPIISKSEDLMQIDRGLFPVYGFLKSKDLKLLQEIKGDVFSVTPLRTSASRVFVRLDRADSP